MNVDSLRAFARATRAKRELEAQLRDINARLDQLADVALKELDADGVSSVPLDVDGERMTVRRHSILSPVMREGVERPAVAACLKMHAPELVREDYNALSFAAWLREWLGDRELPLPDDLAALIEVREVRSARAVESSKVESKSERAKRSLGAGTSARADAGDC